MAHPYHKGVKGQQGGSLSKVSNNLLKACVNILPEQQAKVKSKLAGLKSPVAKLPKV